MFFQIKELKSLPDLDIVIVTPTPNFLLCLIHSKLISQLLKEQMSFL